MLKLKSRPSQKARVVFGYAYKSDISTVFGRTNDDRVIIFLFF